MTTKQVDPGQHQINLCPICQTYQPAFYAVAQCQHKFCRNCSVSYIAAQAEHFSDARCLQEGCKTTLDKTLPIYSLLDAPTIHKLEQFEVYKFLLKHPDHTSCKVNNCSGVLPIKEAKCKKCAAIHCKKCLNLSHEGTCPASADDKMMQQLSFRRCPACRSWVERNEGCQHINCKCGTDFCYSCGNEFDKDPCRRRELWNLEADHRKAMSKISGKLEMKAIDLLLLLPRILFVLAVMLPFTLLFLVVFLFLGLLFMLCLGATVALTIPL
jgi:hypothetical protein